MHELADASADIDDAIKNVTPLIGMAARFVSKALTGGAAGFAKLNSVVVGTAGAITGNEKLQREGAIQRQIASDLWGDATQDRAGPRNATRQAALALREQMSQQSAARAAGHENTRQALAGLFNPGQGLGNAAASQVPFFGDVVKELQKANAKLQELNTSVRDM